jgi:hypothetical protein
MKRNANPKRYRFDHNFMKKSGRYSRHAVFPQCGFQSFQFSAAPVDPSRPGQPLPGPNKKKPADLAVAG